MLRIQGYSYIENIVFVLRWVLTTVSRRSLLPGYKERRMKKRKNADPAHDVLGYERRALDAIFDPDTVAVVGASDRPGSVGRTILWNLISNPFGGVVYPVNAKRPNVLGIKAYRSVRELPEPPELAVVVTPAQTVPHVVRDCAATGVRAMIVISAGFKEIGEEG